MKNTKNFLQLLIMLAMFCTPLIAQNLYYVSTSGSDSNSGTSAGSPWLTLAHAETASTIGTGGIIVTAADGVYDVTNGGGCLSIGTSRNGSSSQPIIFTSTNYHGAHITCSNNDPVTIGTGSNTRTGDYYQLINFDITDTSSTDCNGILDYGAFTKIHGNYIHTLAAPHSNCGNGSGGAGIGLAYNGNLSTAAHDSEVSGNIIDNIGYANGWSNFVHGIYPATSHNSIFDNIVSRVEGWGIQAYHDSCNNAITHNDVFNNLRGGILISADPSICQTTGYSVNNNIVVDNGLGGGNQYGISEASGTSSSASTNAYLNNIVYNNAPANFNFPNGSRNIAGSITLTTAQFNGLFTNYTGNGISGNYQLPMGSVAIGAGTNGGCASGGVSQCEPTNDLAGTAFGSSPAIGAYASVMSSLPGIPTGLNGTVQ